MVSHVKYPKENSIILVLEHVHWSFLDNADDLPYPRQFNPGVVFFKMGF